MDRGSECVETGKGKLWRECAAPFSVVAVPSSRFLESERQRILSEFPLRALPERPDNSEPILLPPFKLRIKHKVQVPSEAIQ